MGGATDAIDGGATDGRLFLAKKMTTLLTAPYHSLQVSLAKKMATLEDALALMEDLRVKSLRPAHSEHAELEAFAGRPLHHWDVAYYSEKLKATRYAYDDEAVRPYLPLDQVWKPLGLWCEALGVKVGVMFDAPCGTQCMDCLD